MKSIVINPKVDLLFDRKVAEMCKSCKRYGKKETCPPNIESVDYYANLLIQYRFGVIYYAEFDSSDDEADIVGRNSSMIIHNHILAERKNLFDNGHYFSIGLGAGSCKLCNRCTHPCPKPDQALIPVEGTGINVVGIMERFGVKIVFPVTRYFYRVGMILYD